MPLYEQGMNFEAMSRELGIGSKALWHWFKRIFAGDPRLTDRKPQRGAFHPYERHTKEEWRMILAQANELREEGLRWKQVAARLGVNEKALRNQAGKQRRR